MVQEEQDLSEDTDTAPQRQPSSGPFAGPLLRFHNLIYGKRLVDVPAHLELY